MPLSFLFEHIKKWWNKLSPEAGEVIFGQTFSKLWNMKCFKRYCLSIDQWSFKNRVRKPSISGICLKTFPGKKMNKILIQLLQIKSNSYSRRETPPPSVDFYDRRLVISSAILKQGSFCYRYYLKRSLPNFRISLINTDTLIIAEQVIIRAVLESFETSILQGKVKKLGNLIILIIWYHFCHIIWEFLKKCSKLKKK